MIQKFIDWYLKKKNLKTVNEKEYDHVIQYRATRGQLKKVIDDNNELVSLMANSLSLKSLKTALINKGIDNVPSSKEDLQKLFIDTYTKEFKKN